MAKIAVKKAGVMKATPTATITVAASSIGALLVTAPSVRPSATASSASPPTVSGGCRSGIRANAIRQTITTMP